MAALLLWKEIKYLLNFKIIPFKACKNAWADKLIKMWANLLNACICSCKDTHQKGI
jgi:hypothetical protein